MNYNCGPLWMALCMCLFALPAMALNWDLPEGRYQRQPKPGELKQVQILPEKGLRLIFAPGDKHALAVLTASYKMTAQKFSDYNITAKVRSMSLGKRKAKHIERMGLTITPGQKLKFTLSYGCSKGHDLLQICLHDTIDGKPHVVCHELSDPDSRCTPIERPPGHLINPPPNSLGK